MRVFAAIVPPEAAVQHLVDRMGSELGSLPSMDWADPDIWHLTLAFFGNISQQDLARLDIALDPLTKKWAPINARLRGVAGFPDDAEAQSLYTEVAAEEGLLDRLSGEVLRSVKGFGWLLDRRSFRPHISLARAHQQVDIRKLTAAYSGYEGPEWVADTIAILWQRPGQGKKVDYDIVGAYPLRGE